MNDEEATQPEDTAETQAGLLLAQGTRLRIQRAGSEKRVYAEVIGFGGSGVHAYIILGRDPAEDAGALHGLNLRPDDTLLVRCLYDGVIYGFRTTITRLLTEPDYLLFVLYPHAVEQVSVRHYPRLRCALPCEVELAGADPRALMLDVSATGCGLVGRCAEDAEPPEPGAPISVSLPVPGSAAPVTLDGELCRIGTGNGRWEGGVRFSGEHNALFEQLEPHLTLAMRR